MSRMWILMFLAGCQEYDLIPPPTPVSLPALPATIPAEPSTAPSPTPDPGVASEAVYANTFDMLFVVEPSTGERLLIGQFHLPGGQTLERGMTDIAIDSHGRMFGGTDDALYVINAETAEVALLCTAPNRQMRAMAFTPNDELIASGQDGAIRIFNVVNCGTELVVDDPIFNTSGDLVGLPDGYLYWTVAGEHDDDPDGLVRIDPNNWYLQYLGELPFEKLFGLGYANGELFGFSRNGTTVAIQPTGAPPANGLIPAVAVDSDSDISWWGATTNPVAWSDSE